MATNQSIKEDTLKLNVGSPLVELYKLDLTPIGGSTYYFSKGPIDGEIIYFNSVPYPPIPVETEGFEYPGNGKMPRPILRLSNILMTFLSTVIDYNDMVGAILTRRRTFRKYLDGETNADPYAQFPTDVFYVECKKRQNKHLIEWELICALDLENLLVPKRQCLNVCSHRYSTTEAWATCPYDGSNGYFDDEGEVTDLAGDMCGKKLFDCKLRYDGDNDKLPFRAFPGVGGIPGAYK